VTEALEQVFGSKFMFLSLDTCRDPDREKILTTADTPPLSHLSEHADGKWGSGVNWEKSFCLHLWSFIQITIRNIYVHLLRIFRIYGESTPLTASCHLVASRVDLNPQAIMTVNSIPSVIMA